MFLKQFIGDYPWAHLDIAGTAIMEEAMGYIPKGGSGVGVRLLTDYLQHLPALRSHSYNRGYISDETSHRSL